MGRFIPEETLEEIRSKADLVDVVGSYLPLQKRGADHWGCCPFHHEKTPSFKVNGDRQVFYCFGCKKSGNVFHFVQAMENTDFAGACEWLADRYGIRIPETGGRGDASQAARRRKFREDGLALLTAAAAWYRKLLWEHPQAETARQYLDSRGLDRDAAERFELGYSLDAWDEFYKWAVYQGASQDLMLATGMLSQKPEDPARVYDRFRGRLMFPIKDPLGQTLGFSARVLDSAAKAAKYVNSPESEFFHKGEILYGLNFARAALKDRPALVCEGQMDVIACHRAGLVQAVAAQGTAFTPMHARLLRKSTSEARLAFDGDEAGMKATLRTVGILQEAGLAVSIVTIPDQEDPDSIFRAGGAAALRQIMSVAEDAVPYVFRWAGSRSDPDDPQGKSRIVDQVMPVVATIQDEVARTAHAQWLAERLGLPEHVMLHRLDACRAQLERQRSTAERYAGLRGRPPLRGQSRPAAGGPGSGGGPAMPFFSFDVPGLQAPLAPAVGALLDLCVHYEDIAAQLVQEDIVPLLPDLPVAGALNWALACVEAGEWSMLADQLAGGELAGIPEVGQVLNDSQYLQLDPGKAADDDARDQRKELLRQAARDCVGKLRIARLDDRCEETRELMRQAEGDERKELARELFRIVKEKNQLKDSLLREST